MFNQIFLNGLIAWSIYLLAGLGFSLIYRVVRFFHFAHGVVITAGGYGTFVCCAYLGLPIWLAASIAIILCVVIGLIMLHAVYNPLMRRNSSPLVLLLASLGIYIVLQNGISMLFGDELKSISHGLISEGLIIAGARITPVQMYAIGGSVGLLFAFELLLKRTRFGTIIRAVANDRELALVSGISDRSVLFWAFGMGSAMAAVAGIALSVDTGITPAMGMTPLLMGVVSVIIGGIEHSSGLAVGALVLAISQQAVSWYFGAQWTDVIAFLILWTFLLFRPQGLFKERRIETAT